MTWELRPIDVANLRIEADRANNDERNQMHALLNAYEDQSTRHERIGKLLELAEDIVPEEVADLDDIPDDASERLELLAKAFEWLAAEVERFRDAVEAAERDASRLLGSLEDFPDELTEQDDLRKATDAARELVETLKAVTE